MSVDRSGRILIPAEVRRRLGLQEGSKVILRVEAGVVLVGTRDQAARRAQQRLERYVQPGRVLSEELIAERREEAVRESRAR